MLVVDINDYDKIFRIFNIDNDGRISSIEFQDGFKLLHLDQVFGDEQVLQLFNAIARPEEDPEAEETELFYVSQQDFPRLWAQIAEQLNDQIACLRPVQPMDMALDVPAQENGMSRDSPRIFCCSSKTAFRSAGAAYCAGGAAECGLAVCIGGGNKVLLAGLLGTGGGIMAIGIKLTSFKVIFGYGPRARLVGNLRCQIHLVVPPINASQRVQQISMRSRPPRI